MAFCSKCGAVLEPTARFCNICGTAVKNDVPEATAATPSPEGNPYVSAEVQTPVQEQTPPVQMPPYQASSYQASPYQATSPVQPQQQGYYYANPTPVNIAPPVNEKSWLGITSLVCGILSVTVCCGTIIPSILALIFGFLGLKTSKKTLSIVGLVLGGIGLLLSIIMVIDLAVNWDEISQAWQNAFDSSYYSY